MNRYILIALVLQVAMVLGGNVNEFVLMNLSAALGMGIPLVVAFFYGRGAGSAKAGAAGGIWIGAVGAAVGIALAIALGDQTLPLLAFGTLSSAITGSIGGAIGGAVGR